MPEFPNLPVPRLFEKQALATPDALALTFEDRTLTYAQLNTEANRLAHCLTSHGVGPESIVAMALPRSPELIITLMAIMKAGGAYLPIDIDYPADRIATILAQARPQVAVTDTHHTDLLHAFTGSCVLVDNLDLTQYPDHDPRPDLRSTHPAYVIFTSGSTGRPKGVVVTHHGIASLALSQHERLTAGPGSRVLQFFSISFDAAFWEISMALLTGGQLVLAPPEHLVPGLPLLHLSQQHRLTHLTTTPSILSALQVAGDLPTGTRVIVGGETLTRALVDHWAQGRVLINAYGPTEVTGCASISNPLSPGDTPVIGTPVRNAELFVLDEHLAPCPVGVIGELYVAGPGLARGYLDQPALTAERFLPCPYKGAGTRMYRTGDLVCWQPDGTLDFAGRIDHQVKIRGYRVELGEVESVLSLHPAVDQAAVLAHRTSHTAQLVAYVVADPGLDTAALRAHAEAALPSYMVPVAIVRLDSLPLNANGKLDRNRLPAPRRTTSAAPPQTERQTRLCAAFSDLLGITVGTDDGFFDLGGDSLLAARLASSLSNELAVTVPASAIYLNPTVARLDAWIDSAPAEADELVQIRHGDSPLFLIHPISGDITAFFHLAEALSTSCGIYAVEPVGYSTDATPLDSITDMAARYVQKIRAIAPQGPYRLAGWSLGGVIAFELARLLEDAGSTVEFLGLFDTQAVGGTSHDSDAVVLTDEQILDFLIDTGNRSAAPPEDAARRMVHVFRAMAAAVPNYRPTGLVQADITLFKATDSDDRVLGGDATAQAWEARTTGQVCCRSVPGTHFTMLLPPHVAAAAAALADQLDRTASMSAPN